MRRLFRELWRLLKDDGKILLVSGNDEFVVSPYLLGDEMCNWSYDVKRIHAQRKNSGKALSTYFIYTIYKREL
jgi:hypothetical protein